MSLPIPSRLLATALAAASASALIASASAGTAPPPQPTPAPNPPSISYDYLEAGYTHLWLDDTPLNLFDNHDGYHLGLNKSLSPNFFLLADFSQVFASESADLHAFGQNVSVSGDLNSLSAVLGLGFHTPVARNIDWVLQTGATYSRIELDLEGRNHRYSWSLDEAATIDGFGIQAATGFRFALANWIELDLFYQYAWSDAEAEVLGNNFASSDADVHSGKAALIFRNLAVANLDLVLSGLLAENGQNLLVGLRYNF